MSLGNKGRELAGGPCALARAWRALCEAPVHRAAVPGSSGPGPVPGAAGAQWHGCMDWHELDHGRGTEHSPYVPVTLTSPEAWQLLPVLQQTPGGPSKCAWLRDR